MQVQEVDEVVVVGVLTDQCASVWRTMEPFVEAGKRSFVLDLAQVDFLNSLSIAAMISARNKCLAHGAKVALANLRPNVREVFRILKLDRLFDLGLDLAGASGAVR